LLYREKQTAAARPDSKLRPSKNLAPGPHHEVTCELSGPRNVELNRGLYKLDHAARRNGHAQCQLGTWCCLRRQRRKIHRSRGCQTGHRYIPSLPSGAVGGHFLTQDIRGFLTRFGEGCRSSADLAGRTGHASFSGYGLWRYDTRGASPNLALSCNQAAGTHAATAASVGNRSESPDVRSLAQPRHVGRMRPSNQSMPYSRS
jgi:hypothetical protein